MTRHPYESAPERAFWKRAFDVLGTPTNLLEGPPLVQRGERVASAGSCFAANIVPFLERANLEYARKEPPHPAFREVADDHFNYAKFSAAYGNIYTARQAVQLLKRALGRFKPAEDRWRVTDDTVVDPFRPGLKYPAVSDREFDLLTEQHLSCVLDAVRASDVFIFTLGLTEAWISAEDGAVYPACPGTIAGSFDPSKHKFLNLRASDVSQDLDDFTRLLVELRPKIRVVLTVSPVPLVATATEKHVLVATTYSKSVLRVAAGECAEHAANVAYFPAYEIVTGPQAPHSYYNDDRREPSSSAIEAVMDAFLSHCECDYLCHPLNADMAKPEPQLVEDKSSSVSLQNDFAAHLSTLIARAQCEEAAAGR